MTRTIHSVALLATGAFLLIPVSMAAQGAPRPASQPAAATAPATATATAAPTAISDSDIAMLRADIRSKRKQIVAANMTLTADEATRFWPLFDQYTADVRTINDTRWAMMKDYAAAKGNLTDAQALDHMKKSAAVDGELIALRVKYMPQFEKLIPAKKVVVLYQLDRRMDLLMNLQVASLIPLIDPTR